MMNYESCSSKEPHQNISPMKKEKENSTCKGGETGAWAMTQVHTAARHSNTVLGGGAFLVFFLWWHYQETHDKHFIIDIWWLKRILTLVIIIYFFSAFNIFKEYSMACGKQRVGINTAHVISKLSLQTGDVFSDIALPASLKKKKNSSYSHFI